MFYDATGLARIFLSGNEQYAVGRPLPKRAMRLKRAGVEG
jgi:hypothetical protein